MTKVFLKGRKFEQIIARKNLSQAVIAHIIGMSEEDLSMLKKPKKYGIGVGPDRREKMLKTIGCDFDDIFFVNNS